MNTKIRYGLMGVGLFVAGWQTLSIIFHEIIIASPADTFFSLIQMVQTIDFWKNVSITIERFGLALLFGSLIGFVLGLMAGLNKKMRWLFEPFRWSLMTMPPVVLVVVSMIWFGMGSVQTIFVTALLIIPIIYVNTIEGIEAVDKRILEMGRVYKAGPWMLLKEIYLPGIVFELSSLYALQYYYYYCAAQQIVNQVLYCFLLLHSPISQWYSYCAALLR
ncbi:MAG: ABC transporter permease subunit [Desulfobacula sp.]|uniref:ABC transporter permease n=1 Tax=Desulfobacula sp. TaxID=2593537 RepID=UPI0025BB9F97|nr:ABC transporter permease subunit [Desulfobacula sp.]MCD4718532.1 ABC transporter permease subunit [Desulfobacula sp.]